MLEENALDFQRVLDLLEDPIQDKPIARVQYYNAVITALDNETEMNTTTVDRLLTVCVNDLNDDKKSIVQVLRIIKSVLNRIKAGDFPGLSNVLPSALAVLNILKEATMLNTQETVPTLCFETLSSYPDETLVQFVTVHTPEIIDVLNCICLHQISDIVLPHEIRVLPFRLVLKLLKILPPEKKLIFVKENLFTWFSKVLPAAILTISGGIFENSLTATTLEMLECLTSELVQIDYAENPHWLEFFKSIYKPEKYPKMMKQMLNSGNNQWHRLWIMFSKLLKHQITKTTASLSSPINAMLPVVELAFKMDVLNRCRAFECWNALIDNFGMELNEAHIIKRLKLLIIPLKSNNAKVEETALAKLNTWWRLILCYQTKLDKLVDKMLIPFLHFCFGKHVGMSPKSSCVPGLLTANTKRKSVEAFVELAGHLCCSGCVNVPKLNRRAFSVSILVNHWNDLIYSLKFAITILNEDVGLTITQIECLWKSILVTVAELPDNNIKKDLFNELLAILEGFEKQSETNNNLSKIVFHLRCSLFGEEKIEVLVKFKSKDSSIPLFKIIASLLSSSYDVFYRRGDTADIVKKMKPLANYILKSQIPISMLLKNYSQQNISLLLTAITESVYETKYEEIGGLTELMLWPLKPANFFIDTEYSTKAWVSLIIYMYPKLKANIKERLRSSLSRDFIESNTQLKLQICIAILKHELENNSAVGCTKNVELLVTLTNTIFDHKYVGDNLKTLTDTLISIIHKASDHNFAPVLTNTLNVIDKIFKFMVHILAEEKEDIKEKLLSYENLLLYIGVIIQNKQYTSFTETLMKELLLSSTLLHKYPSLKQCVIGVMKVYLENLNSDPSILDLVKHFVKFESKNNIEKPSKPPNKDFIPPDSKIITKKNKETTILNTVVENGEKYEVIKSNWKFNPRKLTENQKEKLQRKREDIPALYQDLSQSQDDFKLSTWKTDSQDASSTNSKSTTNSKSGSSGNVSEILKNITSADVVPKIIESITSEKKDAEIIPDEKTVNVPNNKLKQINAKDPKSPRFSLKDRVFRNVRNLIEKSSVHKDIKDLSESLIQVENVPKTPTLKLVANTDLVKTAPAILGGERPSRVKRKPKKFDDVQLISLKKRRRSSSHNDSQSDSQKESQESNDNTEEPNSHVKTVDIEPLIKQPSDKINASNEAPTLAIAEDNQINKLDETKCDSIDNDNYIVKLNINQETLPEKNSSEIQVKEIKEVDEVITNAVIHSTDISETTTVENKHNDIEKETQPATDDKDVNIDCTPQEILSISSCSINQVRDDFPGNNENTTGKSDTPKLDGKLGTQTIKGSTKDVKTPKQPKKQEIVVEPRSRKRNSARKSRIEKELAIDTVEGHPLLKNHSEKRMTRKNLSTPLSNSRRKGLTDKLNKSKVDTKTPTKTQTSLKKKEKELSFAGKDTASATVGETQDKCSENSDDLPFSEDVIESSQDSTLTTISVKPSKPVNKKLAVVFQITPLVPSVESTSEKQKSLELLSINETSDIHNNDDTELPQNKTAVADKTDMDLTENMDTLPVDINAIEENQNSSDVIIINDDEGPIVIGSETQEIAEADTQPADTTSETQEIAEADTQTANTYDFSEVSSPIKTRATVSAHENDEIQISGIDNNTANEITTTMNESMDISAKPCDENTVSSPFKDEEQRKKDFLDNTFEISPIKTMSPVRDNKSPSPETSSDYVLIKLSSPVQSNGEPFEKCDSPEIFTEDKVSPDKRDLSPPREENMVNNTSPSSSLSLKKNRPQVRSGGRAAQMLGLCVPDRLQTIMNTERSEPEEPKKGSLSNTPARRNLRILYNSVGGDSSENSEENEEGEKFLKFKRILPTSDCSPSGPILKRKLAEITDDATISPASKRKRVSFHDPPVSTTLSVQKYIEPLGIRSPQNSLQKRLERQNIRTQTTLKSAKKLDNVFKLDTVLTKAVESFTEPDQTSTDITQSVSLDETPALEIVRNSDLNDVDPICPDLVDCNDLIDEIASDLSSPTMKTMFLKEIEGKITTIGDLAKMSELEVNRLCIKAPKVKIAKKVLDDYAAKKNITEVESMETIEILEDEIPQEDSTPVKIDAEVQSNVDNCDIGMQTVPVSTAVICVQTDDNLTADSSAQTNESGAKSTKDVITSCLAERPDFVESLCECLEESSSRRIAENLPANSITDIFMKNVTSANSYDLVTRMLRERNKCNSSKGQSEKDLLFLQNYLSDRFNNSDLILFCSQLLAKIHNKPS